MSDKVKRVVIEVRGGLAEISSDSPNIECFVVEHDVDPKGIVHLVKPRLDVRHVEARASEVKTWRKRTCETCGQHRWEPVRR